MSGSESSGWKTLSCGLCRCITTECCRLRITPLPNKTFFCRLRHCATAVMMPCSFLMKGSALRYMSSDWIHCQSKLCTNNTVTTDQSLSTNAVAPPRHSKLIHKKRNTLRREKMIKSKVCWQCMDYLHSDILWIEITVNLHFWICSAVQRGSTASWYAFWRSWRRHSGRHFLCDVITIRMHTVTTYRVGVQSIYDFTTIIMSTCLATPRASKWVSWCRRFLLRPPHMLSDRTQFP